jgi:hypothetical protein
MLTVLYGVAAIGTVYLGHEMVTKVAAGHGIGGLVIGLPAFFFFRWLGHALERRL